MEGEWLCYGGGQFNGGRMVMCYIGGHFNGGKMVTLQRVSLFGNRIVMLQRWPV